MERVGVLGASNVCETAHHLYRQKVVLLTDAHSPYRFPQSWIHETGPSVIEDGS
jgi:hypothetical protein